MYDFHFGDLEKIRKDPEGFLVFVKRMLPRWINGIPDSECIAIYRVLQGIGKNDTTLVETGCGASTIAMFLHVALNGGHCYSWDTNGSKGSFLRSVISEAICRPLGVDIYKHWTFIGFDSTNEHVGIPVLRELGRVPDFGFFDSWHTLDHLMAELNCFTKVVGDDFLIALDDAYYRKRRQNYSYLNMIRTKLGLLYVDEPADNLCEPFHVEVGNYLNENFADVAKVNDSYKAEYENDLFFRYFSGDRVAMGAFGMENSEELEHRFDCWQVQK